MCLLFPRGSKGAKNYFPVPNKWGTGNLITLVLRVFLFENKAKHVIRLNMQNKSEISFIIF